MTRKRDDVTRSKYRINSIDVQTQHQTLQDDNLPFGVKVLQQQAVEQQLQQQKVVAGDYCNNVAHDIDDDENDENDNDDDDDDDEIDDVVKPCTDTGIGGEIIRSNRNNVSSQQHTISSERFEDDDEGEEDNEGISFNLDGSYNSNNKIILSTSKFNNDEDDNVGAEDDEEDDAEDDQEGDQEEESEEDLDDDEYGIVLQNELDKLRIEREEVKKRRNQVRDQYEDLKLENMALQNQLYQAKKKLATKLLLSSTAPTTTTKPTITNQIEKRKQQGSSRRVVGIGSEREREREKEKEKEQKEEKMIVKMPVGTESSSSPMELSAEILKQKKQETIQTINDIQHQLNELKRQCQEQQQQQQQQQQQLYRTKYNVDKRIK